MSCAFCTPADTGQLREELAEIYTRDFVMLSMYDPSVRIIRKLVRATGFTEQLSRGSSYTCLPMPMTTTEKALGETR